MNNLLQEFSLALQIGNQQVKLTINLADTKDTIFQKLKTLYPQCTNKKDQTLSKLREDLATKVKLNSVKPNLRLTIEHYLKNVFKQEKQVQQDILKDKMKQIIKSNSFLTTRNISKAQSPIKNEPTKKQAKPTNINLQAHHSNHKLQPKPEKKKLGTICYKQNKRGSVNKCDPKRQQLGQDVIKAYLTIMQKSNQTDIKQMAKKYLQELGRLPVSQVKNQKTIFIPPTQTITVSRNDQNGQITSLKPTERNTIYRQNMQKSPIEMINTVTNRKQSDPQLEQPNKYLKEHNSHQYISKQFNMRNLKTNRYNYLVPDNNIINLKQYDQISYNNQSSIAFVGRSPHRSRSNQRKFNYLSNLN